MESRKTRYDKSIPWSNLQEFIIHYRDKAFLRSLKVDGLQEVGRAQGQALTFDLLLELPRLLEQFEDGIEIE